MENRFGFYGRESIGDEEEFGEEDVWGAFKERKDPYSDSRAISSFKELSLLAKNIPTATRMIPKSKQTSQEPKTVRHSAPLNVPDWSKIYGTSSGKIDSESGHPLARSSSWESDDDDEDDDVMIPPHEWIARKLARSQISSFSVCEGAGRTLKGRDLSRVRNAVLTKTGFLESNSKC